MCFSLQKCPDERLTLTNAYWDDLKNCHTAVQQKQEL